VRFGVGDFSGQRPPGSPASHQQLYAELQDQAELIEAAGLDSMWLSEHHFTEDGYMPAVLPIAAALLSRTRRITVATDRLAASLHNPVRLAEDAIALDLLSGGRFILGLSLCYRDEEFGGYGVDRVTDVPRLEALVPLLRAAFDGRTMSSDGPDHHVLAVHVTPSPDTPGGPKLMIAADGEHGAVRSARLADMLMVDPTEPWQVLDSAVAAFDGERGNREGELVLFTYGAVSESGRDPAWAEVADGFRYMRHTYDRWMGRAVTTELPPAHYRLLLGTPDEVAHLAREYQLRYGDRVHLVLRCNYPGMPSEAVVRQIRLWGEAADIARSVGAGRIST
jgi:alkanesulfonate monooxygenase SsuD/methylene tetrahydromethanopterin reductase-like flavin-dependent oxidoreductase (luciferase family)